MTVDSISGGARVAIVTVNYRTPGLVMRCVESLASERSAIGEPLQVVVVDGGSGDGSADVLAEWLSQDPYIGWTTFIRLQLNGGFGWANNQAILRLLQSRNPPTLIHLLNPDAMVEPGAVARLIEVMDGCRECGAAGSQLLDENGEPAGSAFRFPTPARELLAGSKTSALGQLLGIKPVLVQFGDDVEVDWATGASLMLRVEALRQVGLFDDGFFLYFEEVELMHRLRSGGWTVRHVSRSRVRHVGGASTGVNEDHSERAQRRPPYWYQSRRRYFALTHGRFGAICASLAWLAGDVLWRLRKGIAGNTSKTEVPHERADLLAHGIIPTAKDLTPNIPRWNSMPGAPPAWKE